MLRLHYAETLRAWRMRFLAQRDRAADIYDERFCRMWEFYLAGCEAAFRHGGLVVFQIQLSKRIEAVPLTRDYIAAGERAQETRPLAPGMADIAVRESAGRGRGVFAARAFRKGETIEVCPVVALSESEARNLDRTPLYDYYFGWGEGGKGAAIVMGYGSIYNHSRTPNAVYRKNEQDGTITFTAARAISAGEEILIRYNTGSRESPDRMWFEVA